LEEDLYELPDFQLEESSLDEAEQLTDFDLEEELSEEPEEVPPEEPTPETQVSAEAEQQPIAYSRPAEGEVPQRRTGHVLLFIGFIVLSLAALAFLVFFMFRLLRGPEIPPLEARLQSARVIFSPAVIPFFYRGAKRHRTRTTR
jgi:hypothetical protein